MNKNILFGVGVVVLIFGGYLFLTKGVTDTDSLAKITEEERMMQEDKKMLEEKTMMEKKAMEDKAVMEKEAMMKKDSMNAEGEAMKKDDAMMKTEEESMKKDDSAMAKPADVMIQKGSYEVYEPSKLALAEKGDVVLFFKASWCPSCKTVDADIKANRSSIRDGLTILEVDYDNSQALKTKYGVTYQHTFVQVDSKGNLLSKWSGSPTLAALTLNVK